MENKMMIAICFFAVMLSLPVNAATDTTKEYRQTLEECWQKWNTKNTQSDEEILNIINASETCMQKLGYSIIDRFYTSNKVKIKENFDVFVNATKQFENDICTKSDLSKENTVSIKEVTAASSSLYLLKKALEDIISMVEWDLADEAE
ncbi:MAG TPA: hypothetical protein DIC64_03120 [Alphaproteobacteria bacterium]|nr:hypothetical protein [Alphaproteobacteria bacterium]